MEDEDIGLLFDLCKDDFPLLSSSQTVNVGGFLHELLKTGLTRDDPRIQNLMMELSNLKILQRLDGIDQLKLNKTDFKRCKTSHSYIFSEYFN